MSLTIAPLSGMLSRYKVWRSLPPDERPDAIQTEREFAKYYGLSMATLRQWESDPKFWEDAFAIAKATIGRRLPEILTALAKRASDGNVPAIKLSLEVLGVHHDKVEHSVDFEDDRLIVIMPTGAAMPQHLLRATNAPESIEDDGNKYDIIEQEPTKKITAGKPVPTQYRPRTTRGPRAVMRPEEEEIVISDDVEE